MRQSIPIRDIIHAFLVAFGSLLIAIGFNMFLIPHQLLSGGVSGVSMVVGYFLHWNIGLLYFVFNLPILIWGWFVVGRRFVLLSILSVLLTTWFMLIVPDNPFNHDPLLGSVFGGVIIGIGTGISLRVGGSTGGFDIIGFIITMNRNVPLGTLLFLLNSIVVFALGYLFNWDLALRSMLSIFIAGKVIDTVHIRQLKITAFIITQYKLQIIERLHQLPRGVTLVKTEGAFTGNNQDMLMTVMTRYELAALRKIIREVDPKAWVNIVETVEVIGEFRRLR